MAAQETFEAGVEYTGQAAVDLFNAVNSFYGYNNSSNNGFPSFNFSYIDPGGSSGGGGGGGGSSLSSWMQNNIGGNNFNSSQFGFSQEDPSPSRKYLKNKSTFSRWGIETTEVQYQLDHFNTILELKQIISKTQDFTDKIDDITDWTPAINGMKGFYDLVKEGVKSLNPTTLILVLGTTTISIENSKAKDFLDMYRNVQSNYSDIHSKSPINMQGITVNIDMIKGPQNHIWSRYSFYDIYTHRYLGGRTFE